MPYGLSKVEAEKYVWSFVDNKKPNFRVVVINPSLIYGPILKNSPASESSTSKINSCIIL